MVFPETYLSDDGIYRFSRSKKYEISAEAMKKFVSYQTNIDLISKEGKSLAAEFTKLGVGRNAALELGAGTGRLSSSVIASGYFNNLLITDASEELVHETKQRIKNTSLSSETEADFGVMLDTDISYFQEESLDAVFLAAALHHFLDWRSVIKSMKEVLRANGVIMLTDPCLEFSYMLSVLLISFQQKLKLMNVDLPKEAQRRITNFIGACKLRGNPTSPNKNQSEDKHLFRIADLYEIAQNLDMNIHIFPDSSFQRFVPFGEPVPSNWSFTERVRSVLTRTQHFPEETCDLFADIMEQELNFISELWQSGCGPHANFVAILQKKQDK